VNRYRYCGLALASELALPELATDDRVTLPPDIEIELGEVRLSDRGILAHGPVWAVGPEHGFWWLDEVARFHVQPGRIRVQAEPGSEPGLLRALLLEGPLVMAMQYLGEFCLAVAAYADQHGATALRFMSGGGASTAVAWRVIRGDRSTRVLADSLLRVSTDPDSGRPLAWPQGSGLILWPPAIELLHLNEHLNGKGSLPIRNALAARRLYLPAADGPRPLGAILRAGSYNRLVQSDCGDDEVHSRRQPFHFAATRTAGRLWIDPMGQGAAHFAWCLDIARHCRVGQATLETLYPENR